MNISSPFPDSISGAQLTMFSSHARTHTHAHTRLQVKIFNIVIASITAIVVTVSSTRVVWSSVDIVHLIGYSCELDLVSAALNVTDDQHTRVILLYSAEMGSGSQVYSQFEKKKKKKVKSVVNHKASLVPRPLVAHGCKANHKTRSCCGLLCGAFKKL